MLFYFLLLFMLERWNWFSRATYNVPNIKAKFTIWICVFSSDIHSSRTDTIILFTDIEYFRNELYLTKCDNMYMKFLHFFTYGSCVWKMFHKINLLMHDISPTLFILDDNEYSFVSFKANECCFIFIMHWY